MLMLLLTLPAIVAGAHSLYQLTIDVTVTKSGDFIITEKREMGITDQGTEGFIKVYNLKDGSEVKDVHVTDETGTEYKELGRDWDVDASRTYKTNKCGLVKVDAGYEVCWGIGDSGDRTYYVTYTVTNQLRSYTESDGFNFMFYEADNPIARKAAVIIRHEDSIPLNKSNAHIWAFQYKGNIFFKDSCIVAEMEPGTMVSSKGIVILAEFKKGLFTPAESVSNTFLKALKEKAFEGSDYNLEDTVGAPGTTSYDGGAYKPYKKPWYKDVYDDLKGYLWGFLAIFGLYGGITANTARKNRKEKQRLFGNTKADIDVWSRELPYNGDLCHSNAVLKLIDKKAADNQNCIQAFIMRMISLKLISIQPSADHESSELYITPPAPACPYPTNDIAGMFMYELQKLMFAAAGVDHKLQPQEMSDYVRVNPVSHRAQVNYMQGLLDSFGITNLSQLSRDDVVQVFGLKKFLQEFTLSSERTMGEVGLWKEYLVHATLFGIAKQVRKDMIATWPDVNRIEGLTMQLAEETDYYAHTMALSTLSALNYVKTYETPEERRQRERSEGSGGSSSWGGGGGHSGGGGSGVR